MNLPQLPARTLMLDEMAHLVISNKIGVIEMLNEAGILTPENILDEELVRALSDKNTDYQINAGMMRLLKENPYRQGCIHCFQPIKDVKEKLSRSPKIG